MGHVAPAGVLVLGCLFGAVTGLLAVGLVLVYRTTRVVNFAYGAMGGLPASLGIELYLAKGVPWPVAAGLAVAAGVVTGLVVERLVIRRFATASRLVLTVATIGLAQVLGGAEMLVPVLFGRSPLVPAFPTPFTRLQFEIHPVVLTGNDLLIVAVVPVVLGGLSWFLLRTDEGRAVRAIAENTERALLLGIPVRRLSALVWGMVGGLAALTVVLRAPGQGLTIDAAAGPSLLLAALAAAVLAGMGSLPAAFGAGVGLGVFDQIVRWNTSQQAVTTVVFCAVILVALLARRGGRSRVEAADESSWSLTGGARPLPAAVAALPEVRLGRAALAAAVAGVDRLERLGQPRPGRPGRRRRGGGGQPRGQGQPRPVPHRGRLRPGRGGGRRAHRPARLPGQGHVPGRDHPGLRRGHGVVHRQPDQLPELDPGRLRPAGAVEARGPVGGAADVLPVPGGAGGGGAG